MSSPPEYHPRRPGPGEGARPPYRSGPPNPSGLPYGPGAPDGSGAGPGPVPECRPGPPPADGADRHAPPAWHHPAAEPYPPPGPAGRSAPGRSAPEPSRPAQPPGPVPRQRRGDRRRIAAFLAGAVVLLAALAGGIVWLGSGYDTEGTGTDAARGAASGAADARDAPGDAAGLPGSAISGAAGSGSSVAPVGVPYVRLAPGLCFDSPGLDPTVTTVTTVPCSSPHNGEVIGDEHLSGTLTSQEQVRRAAMALCAPDAAARLKALPKGGPRYYDYAFYPDLATYRRTGQDTVSCTLTLSDTPDGRELTAPLPKG